MVGTTSLLLISGAKVLSVGVALCCNLKTKIAKLETLSFCIVISRIFIAKLETFQKQIF